MKKNSKTDKADSDKNGKPKPKNPNFNYQAYLAKQNMKPRNLGCKVIPVGAPDCLKNLKFVITGVLDSLEREDCKNLIEKYGGSVTTTISGKTNYLIVGDEPGKSKLDKARSSDIPLINEDDLLNMLKKSNPNWESQDSGVDYSEDNGDSEQMKSESDYDGEKSLFSSPAPPTRNGSKFSSPPKAEEPPKKVPKIEDVKKEDSRPASTSAVVQDVGETEPMWVDKYRPKTLKSVVGQSGEGSNAKKLVTWLQRWFVHHGKADDKPKAAWPGLRDPEGKTFKAALLSGPPGIGKTTTAHLAIKEVGYDYYELNASDTRNKKGLHQNVADALSNKTLVFGKSEAEMTRKHVLIMDEVDGMSGNEDRGGVQELIALIKSSRVPIICICNDRNHQKIRSLANYCYDLRFTKPTFVQLKGFIASICFKEKIKIPQEKVQQLIISTDNDVRQILHQLELFKESKTDGAFNPKKDLRFGPWDVIRKVFYRPEHQNMSIHDKTALFFQDYSLGPLFVQENYLRVTPAKARGNIYKQLHLIAKSASSLADGDLVDSIIRRTQNWVPLPVFAVFGSYIPGEYMETDTVGRFEFPMWLGKNSNKGKRQRLLQGLHTHMHLQISGSLEALNMDYLPYLRRSITKPLVEGNVDAAAEVMENYTLLRDDLESITDLALWPGMIDPIEKIPASTKAAFTRKVNKEILPYSIGKPVKTKGRGGGGGGDAEEGLEELLGEEGETVLEDEEEEEESLEKDAMVKVKTRKAGASKAATSSSGARGGGGKKRKKGDDDDEEVNAKASKTSKTSKNQAPQKSRKK